MNEIPVYFKKPGKLNTEQTLIIAREAAARNKIKKIILASSSGETALQAAEIFNGTGIQAIVTGVENYGWILDSEKQKKMKLSGLTLLPCGKYLAPEVANILRRFSQGVKVAIEIAAMAGDAGLINDKEKIISIGGTGFGADTAILLSASFTKSKRDFDVLRLFCLPERPDEEIVDNSMF